MEAWKKKIAGGIGIFPVGIIFLAIGIYFVYNPVIRNPMFKEECIPWYMQAFFILFGIIQILCSIYTIHKGRQIKVKLENAKKR